VEGKVYSFPKKQGEEATFNCLGKDEWKEKCTLSEKNKEKRPLSIALAKMSGRKSVFFSLL